MSDDVRPAGRVGSTASSTAASSVPQQQAVPPRSWLAAIGIGLAVSLLLWLSLLLIPHLLLTRMLALTRDVRVAIATLWIAGATIGLIAIGARVGRAQGGAE